MLFQMYEEDIICAFIDPSLFKDFEILMKSKFKINVMRKITFFGIIHLVKQGRNLCKSKILQEEFT